LNREELKQWIDENLLTKQEIIHYYNITSVSFDNYVRRDKVKAFIKKGPRFNLYLKSDVEAFLNENISEIESKNKGVDSYETFRE